MGVFSSWPEILIGKMIQLGNQPSGIVKK